MEQKINPESNVVVRHYAGQEIEIGWDPRRCIHTAECIHSLADRYLGIARYHGALLRCLPPPEIAFGLSVSVT